MGEEDQFAAYKCPECGNIQEAGTDCESCSFGEDEEGWTEVNVYENKDGDLVEV